MATCTKCGYHYDFFTDLWQKDRCPRCHLKAVFGEGAGRAAAGAQHSIAWNQVNGRWNRILATRDVDQDAFGICGMAAALHVLIPRDPHTANQLAAATFYDLWDDVIDTAHDAPEFHTAGQGKHRIDLAYLVRRHAENWRQKPPEVRAVAAGAGAAYNAQIAGHPLSPQQTMAVQTAKLRAIHERFTDYCVSRALGYLLKVTAPARYNTEKCDFGKFFSGGTPNGEQRKALTRSGTLALRTDTVVYIVRDLLGATVDQVAYNTTLRRTPGYWLQDVRRTEFRDLSGLFNLLSGVARPRDFAIAAVDCSFMGRYDRPSAGKPPYTHWVVIEGQRPPIPAAAGDAAHGVLNIWSWGDSHDHPAYGTAQGGRFLGWMDHIYALIIGRF